MPSDSVFHSSAFGPLAGTCYEERLAVAHRHGKLVLKDGHVGDSVCTRCGSVGHWTARCEAL